jgi:hypothetical protein
MVQTKFYSQTIMGNLQEMSEMASFLKYVDLYLTSEWGRF